MMNPYVLMSEYLREVNNAEHEGNQDNLSAEQYFATCIKDRTHPSEEEVLRCIALGTEGGAGSSGSQSAETAPTPPQSGVQVKGWYETPLGPFCWPDAYEEDGQIWKPKVKKAEVSNDFSMSRIHEYVSKLAQADSVSGIHTTEMEQLYEH